jgi:hypothetical protein
MHRCVRAFTHGSSELAPTSCACEGGREGGSEGGRERGREGGRRCGTRERADLSERGNSERELIVFDIDFAQLLF